MKKRLIFTLVLIISWVGVGIQPSQATNTIVNVGLTETYPTHSELVYLDANNYTITVNANGYIWDANTEFYLKKDSTILFVFVEYGIEDIETVTSRLTIKETGNYNFSFFLNDAYADYVNYEVILTEMDLVINPKTDIISEAPYGMLMIIAGIICYALYSKKRWGRKD